MFRFSRKNRYPRLKWWQALAVLVFNALAIAAIWLGDMQFLTQRKVEAQLAAVSAYLTREGGNFTFGSLVFEGPLPTLIGPSVSLYNPIITWKPPLAGGDRWAISTARAVLMPEGGKPGVYRVEFPEPLVLAVNDQPLKRFVFETPPVYMVKPEVDAAGLSYRHDIFLPAKFSVRSAKEPNGPEQIVSMASPPVITLQTRPDSTDATKQVSLRSMQVLRDDAEVDFTLGALDLNGKRETVNGVESQSVQFSVKDVGVKSPQGMDGPYRASLDAVYLRPQGSAEEGDIAVRRFEVAASAYGVSGEGAVSIRAGESLPFGEMTIVVSGVQALNADVGIPPEMRALLMELIGKVTGAEDVSAMTDASFVIKREKNGQAMVGSLTLEDLAALVFARLMMGVPAPAAEPGVPPVVLTPPPAQQAPVQQTQ